MFNRTSAWGKSIFFLISNNNIFTCYFCTGANCIVQTSTEKDLSTISTPTKYPRWSGRLCGTRSELHAEGRSKVGVSIIFGTVEHLRRLEASMVHSKKPPQGFKQIYTIHGSCGTGIERAFMPFVHMLLPNKQETTYRRKAFKALMRVAKRNNVNLNPKIILTDFDSSQTHHSMDVSFTGAKISTSVLRSTNYQRFTQAIWAFINRFDKPQH